jgi:hypothetical protein
VDTNVIELMVAFHDKEPMIANAVILIIAFTPAYGLSLRFLNKRGSQQVEKLKIEKVKSLRPKTPTGNTSRIKRGQA